VVEGGRRGDVFFKTRGRTPSSGLFPSIEVANRVLSGRPKPRTDMSFRTGSPPNRLEDAFPNTLDSIVDVSTTVVTNHVCSDCAYELKVARADERV